MGVKLGYNMLSDGIETVLFCDKCNEQIYKYTTPDGGGQPPDFSDFNENCDCTNELFRIVDGKKIPLITAGGLPPSDPLTKKFQEIRERIAETKNKPLLIKVDDIDSMEGD